MSMNQLLKKMAQKLYPEFQEAEEPSYIEATELMSLFKNLYMALSSNDLEKAKLIAEKIAPDMKEFFKEYASLRSQSYGGEEELSNVHNNFDELNRQASLDSMDLVLQVKYAIEGFDPTKMEVKSLMNKAYEAFSNGLAPNGLEYLGKVIPIAKPLVGSGVLAPEFESFLSDEGMTEWIMDMAGQNKEELTSFDSEAVDFVMKEVVGLVYQNRLFAGDEVRAPIEVEEEKAPEQRSFDDESMKEFFG